MGRFTKRPVTIDAILVDEILDVRGVEAADAFGAMPEWFRIAFVTKVIVIDSIDGVDVALVNTHHGQARADRGDWIIRGVDGELYPCKPDIFEKTYDTAQEPRTWETHDVVVTEGARVKVGRPEDFVQPWEVYRCDQAGPDEACGIRELGIVGKRDVVSDTNREECCHHMRLVDANRIIELHNRQPLTVITIKGDMPPEQFAKFRKEWEASHASVSRAMIFDSEARSVAALSLTDAEVVLLRDVATRDTLGEGYGPAITKLLDGTIIEGRQRVDGLHDQLDAAWGLIANAGGGDWKTQTKEWQEAAARWRDRYCTPTMNDAPTAPSLTEQGRIWAEEWNKKAYVQKDRAGIVDQPPPHNHPDMLPAWEKVIEDYRSRFSDHLNRDTNGDPIAIENALTVSSVLADMRERDKTGREKYGVPLTPFNGRDQLVDAYQEKLDASVYLRAAMMEGIPVPTCIYSQTLDDLTFLRRMITERAKDPRTT